MTNHQSMSEGFKRRFLTLERFMNELERILVSGGTNSGPETRALKHVLNYVTGPEVGANYVSASELKAGLLKDTLTGSRRTSDHGAAATDDLLQLLRGARRAARAMRAGNRKKKYLGRRLEWEHATSLFN